MTPTKQVVDRTLPGVEEEMEKEESTMATKGKKPLRQQSMYQFVCRKYQHGTNHENQRRQQSNIETSAQEARQQQQTQVHGHYHRSGKEIQEDGLFRVYYNNVNGFSHRDDDNDINMFIKTIAKKECAIIAITEPNRNFDTPQQPDEYVTTMRKASKHQQTALASAKLGWTRNRQPGGTAISVRNKWATRYLSQGADAMGRWSYITLTGKGITKITFIVAYRVCDGPNVAPITSKTIRAQQDWMFNTTGKAGVDLRKQCISDLTQVVNAFHQDGHDVVVCMDANEGISSVNSGIANLLRDTGLNDVHAHLLDSTTLPPTHQRGSEKIDYVLVSPRLLEAVDSCSILGLNDGYISDHRALVVDFDPKLLFGNQTSNLVQPAQRLLTSTNPRAVHTYTEHIRKHVRIHAIEKKVEQLLLASETGNWSGTEEKLYEQVCKSMREGRAAAEGKLASKRSGGFAWSPTLDATRLPMFYWKLRAREYTSGIRNQHTIDDLEAAIGPLPPEPIMLTDVRSFVHQQCRMARRAHLTSKMNSDTNREDFQKEAADFEAQRRGTTVTNALSLIKQREKAVRNKRQLDPVFKDAQSSGVDRIEVLNDTAVLRPNESAPRIPLVVKEEIEEVLVPHTMKRFRQPAADGTPFAIGERARRLGRNCDSQDAKNILHGRYDWKLHELTTEARHWMQQLKQHPNVPESCVIDTNINTEEWITGWLKMRESTASAPGGHFGHYKTAAAVARLPPDHEDSFPELAKIYATLVSLPLKHGFAPVEWKTCVDAILEKIPGRPLIEKLRVIMLFDAQFNFALKLVFGRRMIFHAEDHNVLGTANHGGRPGRQVHDALLEKTLMFEHARLTRTSLITVDNDAKSCYDRIIKAMALLACMAIGLPVEAATMHNKVHDEMTHNIKTRHGLLRAYCGTDDGGSDGVGQGSGAAGAIWLVYSNSLITTLKDFSPGVIMVSPNDRLLRVCLLAIFFVDDGTPGVNDAEDEQARPMAALVKQGQNMAQSWERLLFASGGALEFSKCFAYYLFWDLEAGKHRLRSPSEIDGCVHDESSNTFSGPITLTYGNNITSQPIQTESPWIGRRTLGVRIAPGGTWDDEFHYRRQQSHALSLRIAGSNLNRTAARIGYRTIVCPRLEFPLTVTQFSQKQCDQISSPVLNACLAKMGYNRNMPREVVYGPIQSGGLGMHDLFIEQGIKATTALMGHLREQKSHTGQMMRIELQWCQAQAGTSFNLLEEPSIPIEYVETCWIMNLRQFLDTYGLHVHITCPNIPKIACDNDEFLMDAFRLRGDNYGPDMMTQLNACRMYLKVQRVSDICDARGTRIRKEVLAGIECAQYSNTSRWPRQGRPTKKMWSNWKRALKYTFSVDGNVNTLRCPLGPWHSDAIEADAWQTLISLDNGTVYNKRPDGSYDVHARRAIGRNGTSTVFRSTSTTARLPDHVAPADMTPLKRKKHTSVVSRGSVTPDQHRESMETANTFAEYVAAQAHHIRQTLANCDLSSTSAETTIEKLYECDRLSIGTDGGLLDKIGTFGFVFGDPASLDTWATGNGYATGANNNMSSTRTELAGVFAALTYLRLIVQYYCVVLPRESSLTLYCDSKAALAGITQDHRRFGTSRRCRKHYDLLSAITFCTLNLNMPITWQWVKGHASKRKEPHEFTWAETLNEAADHLATAARDSPHLSDDDTYHWPEQQVSVRGSLGQLRGELAKEMRYCCTYRDLETYYQSRYEWSDATFAYVDVDATKGAMAKSDESSKQRIQKLRCGWLPTNSRLRLIQSECEDILPHCSACAPEAEETIDHVLQCPSNERRNATTTQFIALRDQLSDWNTSKHVTRAMLHGATSWLRGEDTPPVGTLNLPECETGTLVKRAYLEQTVLGWRTFFRGFWSSQWGKAQGAHISAQKKSDQHEHGATSRLTGDTWAAKAQHWFFSFFETIWKIRNRQEHGDDNATQRRISLEKCERTIREMYAQNNKLPRGESHAFRDDINTLLQATLADQEQWIALTRPILMKALRRVATLAPGQLLMSNFLVRQQPIPKEKEDIG